MMQTPLSARPSRRSRRATRGGANRLGDRPTNYRLLRLLESGGSKQQVREIMKVQSRVLGWLTCLLWMLATSTSAQAPRAFATLPTYSACAGTIIADSLAGAGWTMPASSLCHPRGITIDTWGGRIYWAEPGSLLIQGCNLDGTNKLPVAPISGYAAGVAFDDIERKLYWADPAVPAIRRCSPDGTGLQDIVTLGISHPIPVAIDVRNRWIYWADWTTHKIQRARLDGTLVQDVVLGLSDDCYGIAVDILGEKIYWSEGYTNGFIRRANLDGSGPEVIHPVLLGPISLAIDLVHRQLYWTQSGLASGGGLFRSNLDGSGVENPYPGTDWWGLALDVGNTPRSYCQAKVNSQGCTPKVGYSGVPSLTQFNDFHVTASNLVNFSPGIMFWGTSPASAPFAGGLRCVAAPVIRTSIQNSGGSPFPVVDCSGNYDVSFTQDYMNAHFLTPATTIYAQFWQRDGLHSDGTGQGLTDGLQFVILP